MCDLIDPLVERSANGHVSVRYINEKRGRGVFSNDSFEENEVIFEEKPLYATQHSCSSAETVTCHHCMRFLNSLESQLQKILTSRGFEAPSIQVPYEDTCAPRLPPAVSCPNQCGFQFCGEDCVRHAMESYHTVMCPVLNPKISEFEAHAATHNDIFLLCARAIIVSATWLQTQEKSKSDSADISTVRKALWKDLPLNRFVSAPWWDLTRAQYEDALESEKESGADDPENTARAYQEDVQNEMRRITSESHGLFLASGVLPPGVADSYPDIATLDYFSRVIGVFELNNCAVVVPSPLAEYINRVRELPSEQRTDESEQLFSSLLSVLRQADCEDGDVPAEGTGLYAIQGMINHSCAPNAHVWKGVGDVDNSAVVLALRDIHDGEEISISYIDEDDSVKARARAITDYLFLCDCSKCQEESAASSSRD